MPLAFLHVPGLHDGTRPDKVGEWRFYVVPTEAIDAELDIQKTISEASLVRRFDVPSLTYLELSEVGITYV